MTISKDVIDDLMPLYLAGEARPGTRRLVEEYLRANPADAPAAVDLTLPPSSPPPSVEMASLNRTRSVYANRSTALGIAFALSYGVFSFRFSSRNGLAFVLYRDQPVLAWVLLGAALFPWAAFLHLQRRWLATGLSPVAHVTYWRWLLGGAAAMFPYAFVLSYHYGLDDVRALCVVGAFVGLAIGHAIHRKPIPS